MAIGNLRGEFMLYADARQKIKSGDIIALTHDAWDSVYDLQVQAVRVFTQSEYAHVGIVWDFAGRKFIIESVSPFVRIVPLSNLVDSGFYHVLMDIPISEIELEFLMSLVGTGKYSKLEAIAAQLNILDIGGSEKWECAEMVISARRQSGVVLDCKATPAALVQCLLEQGKTLQYISNK
jgi:hypothetical protein